MKLALSLLFMAFAMVNAYYTLSVFSPKVPQIHARVINARNRAFIIGAAQPSTFCDLNNATECPDGTSTQVNANMTGLAVSSLLLFQLPSADASRLQFQVVN